MLRMFLRESAGGNAIGSAHSSSKAKQKRQFCYKPGAFVLGSFSTAPFLLLVEFRLNRLVHFFGQIDFEGGMVD